jgi:hypothetical protein
MQFLKRLIWLFFYIPLVTKTYVQLAFLKVKMFLFGIKTKIGALGAGLGGGLKAGAGEAKRLLSDRNKPS